MSHTFQVPTNDDPLTVDVEAGSSIIFVGPNGGGKSRLAVQIEESVGAGAHRISAHRSLNLNPKVAKISQEDALRGLRFGNQGSRANIGSRRVNRWGDQQATRLLNDFDFLVQSLFAEQSNVSLQTHVRKRRNEDFVAEETRFEKLQAIWTRILPKRQLSVTGDNITVSAEGIEPYSASEMSDGERSIFYLTGQTLMAAEGTLIIVDEPELHVHPSVMSKLWDELEAARTDCSFVFITHDLEFAAQRSAQKFVIQDYHPAPRWLIEEVPVETGFSEEISTLILGSRKPILFVEGKDSSWDIAVYRACYPEWTIMPQGSCEEVLHAVATMRRHASLTRVTCAGIVDADGQSAQDIANLEAVGVAVLPVAEIENLFLLPEVSREIARTDNHDDQGIDERVGRLTEAVLQLAREPRALEATVLRYSKRLIDSNFKRLELSSTSVNELTTEFAQVTAALDIAAASEAFRLEIANAIESEDMAVLARLYDNKAFVAEVSRHLKDKQLKPFKEWITRTLRNDSAPDLVRALVNVLPEVTPA